MCQNPELTRVTIAHCDNVSSGGETMVSDSKTVRLNLTADEWRALRVRAAEAGISVAACATAMIRAGLARKTVVKKPS
jgi:hypothetical protein